MTPIEPERLSELADLALESLLQAMGRRQRRRLEQPETRAALQRALHAALVPVVATLHSRDDRPTATLLSQLAAALSEPDMGRALAALLSSGQADGSLIAEILGESVSGLSEPESVNLAARLAGALRIAAEEETALAVPDAAGMPIPDDLREIVEMLVREGLERVGVGMISAGSVQGQNVVVGHQHFHLTSGEVQAAREADAMRAAYLRYLFNTLRPLDLAGLDPGAVERTTRLHLDSVYTALMTKGSEWDGDQERASGRPMNRREKPLSALAQLDRHSQLVLLGDPGSGKSTFVNFVALCLVGERLGEAANLALLCTPLPSGERGRQREAKPAAQPWSHGALVPVRVILRDFAARGLPPAGQEPTAECLWRFIETELMGAAHGEFAPHLKRILRDEGGLILLDGLDEVPEAAERRSQMVAAVAAFRDAFSRCRFLVTSRTYAYQKQEWKLPGFEEAELAPFTPAQVAQFIQRWYAHWGETSGKSQESATARAGQLRATVEQNPRLSEFAKRPLLLTLMASLHAWRGGTLPDQREELYDDAVKLLLERWEQRVITHPDGRKEQQPSFAEFLRVGRDRLRRLLNQLAFEATAASRGWWVRRISSSRHWWTGCWP